MNDGIIEKVKKLLALAESSNEHEANTAMLQVQKLMMKHKLTMKEIEDVKKEPINIVECMTDATFTRARWKSGLASVIADNFGCFTYSIINYKKTICFFGKDEDVTVCKIMLEYALKYIENEVKKYKNQYKRDGRSTRGLENTYASGFISGLEQSFDAQKKENEQEWGLVIVKDPEVVEAHSQISFMKPKALKPLEYAKDGEIYSKAKEDGKNFSISDKIANEGGGTTVIG